MSTPDDPHAALRADVRKLGALLGDTLKAHEGLPLFELVEKVRTLARAARDGSGDAQALHDALKDADTPTAIALARAFSHFLQLANTAEQHHRVRRRRQHQRDAAEPQRGSCEAMLVHLRGKSVDPKTLHDAVCALEVELVLTAHPTQAVRQTLRRKHHRIADALTALDRGDLPPAERAAEEERLAREVEAAWCTDELRSERPTPITEALGGLGAVEETLWDAVPAFCRGLDRALEGATGDGLPLDAAPLRFASWMGGDRDGNPFVTPAVTDQVVFLGRAMAARLFADEVEALGDALSMAEGTQALAALAGTRREPYRAVLRRLRARLTTTRDWCQAAADDLAHGRTARAAPKDALLDEMDLEAPLLACLDSLTATGVTHAAHGRLTDVLRRVAAFGLTLVRLDLRQDSETHELAMAAAAKALGTDGWLDLDEEQRVAALVGWLEQPALTVPAPTPKPGATADDPDAALADALATLAVVRRQGPSAFGAYVISMAQSVSDVLTVHLLQRLAGLEKPLRVAPLFETVEDLERAPRVMEALYALPVYRHLSGGAQEVMIGYSDSAKTAGRLGSAWALFCAQEQLAEISRQAGVRLTIFHGRGGTVGRGGGPTFLAISSLPPGSVGGRTRITVQGEMIEAEFGLPEIAVRNMELYAMATLSATLEPPAAPEPAWRVLMDELAQRSTDAYRTLVQRTPGFLEYFRAATPEGELPLLAIGSRPQRRKTGGGVETLRAIPWIFAWTQTRLLLPSWLGVGEALDAARTGGHGEALHDMARDWPFFRSTLGLIEMVLAKAEPGVAKIYERTLAPERLWPLGESLRTRYLRTVKAVLAARRVDQLLTDNPVLRRSIALRNPYVDPLNLLQAELLKRLREREDAQVMRGLLITMSGVAAGMRNTG